MIFTSSGNAFNSYKTFESAAEYLIKIVEDEPECKDELVLMEFDENGLAVNAFRYEDLIES